MLDRHCSSPNMPCSCCSANCNTRQAAEQQRNNRLSQDGRHRHGPGVLRTHLRRGASAVTVIDAVHRDCPVRRAAVLLRVELRHVGGGQEQVRDGHTKVLIVLRDACEEGANRSIRNVWARRRRRRRRRRCGEVGALRRKEDCAPRGGLAPHVGCQHMSPSPRRSLATQPALRDSGRGSDATHPSSSWSASWHGVGWRASAPTRHGRGLLLGALTSSSPRSTLATFEARSWVASSTSKVLGVIGTSPVLVICRR